MCSRAVIIAKGRIVADSTPEDLLSKAPNHNAVTIRASETPAVRSALEGVAGISEIETLGENWLRIRPETGAVIIDAVGATLREKAIAVDELHLERGRLDDVFRQITATG